MCRELINVIRLFELALYSYLELAQSGEWWRNLPWPQSNYRATGETIYPATIAIMRVAKHNVLVLGAPPVGCKVKCFVLCHPVCQR